MAKHPTSKASVFVDSSVLLAAALSSTGSAADLVRHAATGAITVWLSQIVLDEVERNLQRKAPQGLPRFRVLRDQLARARAAPGQELLDAVARVVEPKDAPIVAGAIAAHAAYLVSYDRRHLLARTAEIERVCGIPVLTPADLLLTLGLSTIEHG